MNFGRISLPPGHQRLENPCSTADNRSEPGIDKRLEIGTQLQVRWEERKGVQRQIRLRVVEGYKSRPRVQSERAIAAGTVVKLYTAEFVPIGRSARVSNDRFAYVSWRVTNPGPEYSRREQSQPEQLLNCTQPNSCRSAGAQGCPTTDSPTCRGGLQIPAPSTVGE